MYSVSSHPYRRRDAGLHWNVSRGKPDWAIHDGNFEEGVTLKARQSRDGNTKLTPAKEELLHEATALGF